MYAVIFRAKHKLPGHQLFHYSTCPFSIKVRLALWLMGLKLPLKDILSHSEYRAELIAGGGKTQVPCLRIEDEQNGVRWMYDSNDIIRYLRRKSAAVRSLNPSQ